ncbi:hypothetical protein COO91_03135 [Nostoc flagelliforme CCNUN1]|uniref:Uncharacterized protein n=1 Tax=Nostoc flagelliforme CCNUN1 TaxID=2038116 RepID=A0A2K8SP59_9NOSO|nr:hypothetical protein COO91_03135 [Nostoc flagelliforme CCNUN1]
MNHTPLPLQGRGWGLGLYLTQPRSAIPAFLTSGAIAMTKPLSGLDFERFRHCMNHSSM